MATVDVPCPICARTGRRGFCTFEHLHVGIHSCALYDHKKEALEIIRNAYGDAAVDHLLACLKELRCRLRYEAEINSVLQGLTRRWPTLAARADRRSSIASALSSMPPAETPAQIVAIASPVPATPPAHHAAPRLLQLGNGCVPGAAVESCRPRSLEGVHADVQQFVHELHVNIHGVCPIDDECYERALQADPLWRHMVRTRNTAETADVVGRPCVMCTRPFEANDETVIAPCCAAPIHRVHSSCVNGLFKRPLSELQSCPGCTNSATDRMLTQ